MATSPSIRWLIANIAIAWLAVTATGCRQQVYHELYAEQNAREIRALEDRIFEYESEFRMLEHEAENYAAENERLRQQLATQGRSSQDSKRGHSSSPAPIVEEEWSGPSVLMPTPDKTPNEPAQDGKSFSLTPKGSQESQLTPSVVEPPELKSNANPAIKEPSGVPASPFPTQQPSNNPPKTELNTPPAILPPPQMDMRDRSQTDLRSSRIVVPEMEASASTVRQASAEETRPSQRVENTQGVVQADQRIVEVVFHPSLCRGNNLDDKPGDDGIYVVLQPMNAKGEFVPAVAKITIVASDPASQEEDPRIALWTFSMEESQKTLQPNGRSQGFHFPLSWQQIEPQGERLHVMVRFEWPNGKTLVAQHDIVLNRKDSLRSVWTPRSENRVRR